jgi:hypothetical protein
MRANGEERVVERIQDNGVAQEAGQQTQRLGGQARRKASELLSRGGEQVKTQLNNQKHDASEGLAPIQTALRETAQQLRKQGQSPVAQYADGAAYRVERFSSYLSETDVEEITEEVRNFARRRSALFLGSAALLGFLGTRFLKSSSSEAPSATGGYGAVGEPVAALPPVDDVEVGEPFEVPVAGEVTEPPRDY